MASQLSIFNYYVKGDYEAPAQIYAIDAELTDEVKGRLFEDIRKFLMDFELIDTQGIPYEFTLDELNQMLSQRLYWIGGGKRVFYREDFQTDLVSVADFKFISQL